MTLQSMKNVIAFCLWGNNPHYHHGALDALESAAKLYPGWETWIYVAEDVSADAEARLERVACRVMRKVRGEGRAKKRNPRAYAYEPAFWRFLPASNPEVGMLLVRDADSPLTPREVAAVEEWLASGKGFHIMRDHPKHECPVLAGMWGARCDLLRDMADLVATWKRFDFYGCDQKFLGKIIYPRVREQALIHSECVMFPHETIHPFPIARVGDEFLGVSHTGDPNRLALQLRYLHEWERAGKPRCLRPDPWSLAGLLRTYSRGRLMRGKEFPAETL